MALPISILLLNYLDQEMVCGLCACEPGTPHGDSAGEARCRYIFRYYNRAADGRLTSDEFRLVMFRCKILNRSSKFFLLFLSGRW